MKMWMPVLAIVLTGAIPAAAQSGPVYLGAVAGVNGGSRGPIQVGTVWTAGGIVGLRLSDAWSVEFEGDRGFATFERDDPETGWISFAPRGSSFPEIERLSVRARFTRIHKARDGYSAHVVWKTREPGAVNAAFYGGISFRNFESRVIRTITHVPDDPAVTRNDPNVRDADETRTVTGGGLTGGVMVPVRVGRQLTLAPDVRFTLGTITDESTYKIFTASVRLIWGL